MLVEAHRYRLALRAYLRNGGRLSDIRQVTACSREDIDLLLRGRLGMVTAGRACKIEELLSPTTQAWVRESESWPCTSGQVPTQIVRPVIEWGFERYGREATARMCRTVERQLFGVLAQRSGVRFELADRIVCALEGPGWWYETQDRRRWYFGHNAVFGTVALKQRWYRRQRQIALV